MNDLVLIKGLKLPVRIGCMPGERVLAQVLEVSLEIAVGKNNSLASGNPNDTVCYLRVSDALKNLVDKNEWPLLEQFAEDSVKMIFEDFAVAQSVTLEVRKFVIPGTEWVGIKIGRSREA